MGPEYNRLKLSTSFTPNGSALGYFAHLLLDLTYYLFDSLDLVSMLKLATSSKSLFALILWWAYNGQVKRKFSDRTQFNHSDFLFLWELALERQKPIEDKVTGYTNYLEARMLLDRFVA